MSKKNDAKAAVFTEVRVPPKAAKVAEEPVAPPTEERGYTTGLWADKTQYRCKSCAWDCLDLDLMLAHLVERHSPLAQNPGAGTQALVEPEGPIPTNLQPDEVAQDIYEIDLKEDQ
jgi:hypothetical protein